MKQPGHRVTMPTSKLKGCQQMRAAINEGVLCLTELGYCFFHNGTHLLKIPKRKFIEALDSHKKSLALTEQYPGFFQMSEAKEARSAYERSLLEFTKK